MYEQLKPLIFIHDWQLENIQLVNEKMYQKEVSFSVGDTLYFQVFFQKQIDWSLDEIILAFGSHKLRHVFSDTSIEDKIEQQVRLVIFD